jgi:outer membrane protein assembly factor BamD (BamD/ComL family)
VPCTLGLALLLSGCAYMEDMFRQKPQALLPATGPLPAGEQDMSKKYYPQARTNFQKIVERHPQSQYAPRARFLIGETYYREASSTRPSRSSRPSWRSIRDTTSPTSSSSGWP